MLTDTIINVLGALAVLAQAFVIVTGVWWLGALAVRPLRTSFDRFAALMHDAAMPIALAVAATASAGSLYFSEVANYTPCILCWYQRIAMYPLVLLLAIALIRRDHAVRVYAMPLAAIGLVVSIYHVQLQLFPDQSAIQCQKEAPCTAQWVDALGYLSIPGLAGTAFAAILMLLGMAWWAARAAHRS